MTRTRIIELKVACLGEDAEEVKRRLEAGESLGFLPGDLQAKVDPYLRPLYDALEDMMPHDRVAKALESLYTMVRRDERGELQTIPYSVFFEESFGERYLPVRKPAANGL